MNLRKYKLLITDIDGTALDSAHELHPETVQAFQQLREFGLSTTIATGKIFPSVEYLIQPLCGDSPFLLGHGSIIQDKDGRILMQRGLSTKAMDIIFKVGEKYHCDIAVYLADGILAKKFNNSMKYLTEYWEPEAEEIALWPDLGGRINDVVKALFINHNSDFVLAQAANELSSTLCGLATVQYSIPHVVEVTNTNATKENGLKFLSTHFDIPVEQMIAVGDGLNDMGMLELVGFGVAMGNAIPELKTNADLVIGSNDENGLAMAIQEWISESK